MLSDRLLAILRAYWKTAKQRPLLFPKRDGTGQLDCARRNAACRAAAEAAGIAKPVTVKTLRYYFVVREVSPSH